MSQTRILCDKCGYPQAFCECSNEREKLVARLRDALEITKQAIDGGIAPADERDERVFMGVEWIYELEQAVKESADALERPTITDEMIERVENRIAVVFAQKRIVIGQVDANGKIDTCSEIDEFLRLMARAALNAVEGE